MKEGHAVQSDATCLQEDYFSGEKMIDNADDAAGEKDFSSGLGDGDAHERSRQTVRPEPSLSRIDSRRAREILSENVLHRVMSFTVEHNALLAADTRLSKREIIHEGAKPSVDACCSICRQGWYNLVQ
jgi:hypothetical protein